MTLKELFNGKSSPCGTAGKAALCGLALLVLLPMLNLLPVEAVGPKPVISGETLRVGLLEDSPPYDFYNGKNELVGLNIDIMREAGRRLHRKVEIKTIPYNRVIMGLLFNHYDVVAAPQSVSAYRKTVVRFIKPYLHSGDVIVYRNGTRPVESLNHVKSRKLRIGAFNGTSYPQFLEKQGLVSQMVVYPTQREMFMAFLNGKVDAMLMDEHIARYYRDREGFPFALSQQAVRTEKDMAFSVRKDSGKLGDDLDRTLDEMRRDGTITTIETRWLGKREMALQPEPGRL